MKKLFLLLIMATLIVACGDDDKPVEKKWDANKMVLIKPDKTAFNMATKASGDEAPQHLSALEIVKQGDMIKFLVIYYNNKKVEKPFYSNRGFSENQKDFTIPALKMWGTDIIDQDGAFVKDFIYGEDVVVTNRETGDTLAYIPNQVLREVREPLETAYNEQRYEDVYRMFDEAFTFKPVTGAEWRELKAQGKQ